VLPGAAVVAMLDYSGSHSYGRLNVKGRAVHAASIYASGGGGSRLLVDGCEQGSSSTSALDSSDGMMVGSRNNEMGRFFLGAVGEVVVFPRALNASELGARSAYFEAQWPAIVPKASCGEPANDLGLELSQAYAATRFMNAVQSRKILPSTDSFPVKFNGQAWLTPRPHPEGDFAGGPDDVRNRIRGDQSPAFRKVD
jgi:hypothetical protein